MRALQGRCRRLRTCSCSCSVSVTLSADMVRMKGLRRRPDTDRGKRLERFQSNDTAGSITCMHSSQVQVLACTFAVHVHARTLPEKRGSGCSWGRA